MELAILLIVYVIICLATVWYLRSGGVDRSWPKQTGEGTGDYEVSFENTGVQWPEFKREVLHQFDLPPEHHLRADDKSQVISMLTPPVFGVLRPPFKWTSGINIKIHLDDETIAVRTRSAPKWLGMNATLIHVAGLTIDMLGQIAEEIEAHDKQISTDDDTR